MAPLKVGQLERLREIHLRWAEHGRKLGGRKPTPPAADTQAARKINTTDPDTRLMKRAGGRSVQGYNAQVVARPEQVIIAAQVTQSHNDSDQLAPMVESATATQRIHSRARTAARPPGAGRRGSRVSCVSP